MAFGFDSSIILAGMPRPPPEPTLNDTFQTLAQLQTHRATLADMLQKQEGERRLADIIQANANNPQAIGPALMQGRLPGPALDWMRHQSEIENRRATAQKMASQIYDLGLQRLRGRASTVKTPEQYDQLVAPIPAEERAQLGLPDQYDPAALEGFIAGGISPTKLQSPEQLDAMAARAELDRAKAETHRRGPNQTPVDATRKETEAAKLEALQLKNEENRRKQAAADKPDELLMLEGYDRRPGFKAKPEVIEKLRAAQADTRSMKKNVNDLMALYQKYGNEVLPGTARARMSAIATHLQLKAKGKTMFELGVIAGPDMGLLNSVIADPTKKEATLKDFFSGGGELSETMEKLRVMREQLDENFDSAAFTRGYDPKKKGGGAAGPGGLTKEEADELARLEGKFGGQK